MPHPTLFRLEQASESNSTLDWSAKVSLGNTLEYPRLSAPTATVKLDIQTKQRVQRLAALAAWEQYQATGLHVTAAEADKWLAKLEAGKDAPPPTCHDRSGCNRTLVRFWNPTQ